MDTNGTTATQEAQHGLNGHAAEPIKPQENGVASAETTNGHSQAEKTKAVDSSKQDRLPDQSELDKAADIPLKKEDGTSITFGELSSEDESGKSKHLIVFVRHFFCGLCQDYLRALAREVPASSLPDDTKITIIGCGQPEVIPRYRDETKCPYPIYADPSRKIYDVLGMTQNLSMGPKMPEYQSKNSVSMVLDGTVQCLRAGMQGFKGGKISQLGGEMLFVDGKPTWAHRMTHTRDHTEIAALKPVLGL